MKIVQYPRFLLFAILVFFFNCTPQDDPVVEIPIENLMKIMVNGEPFEVINENIGGNENCDILYVNTYYHDKDKIQFRVEFTLSQTGQLLRVWYDEFTFPIQGGQQAKIFLAPNFNPTRTFEISDFYYNSNSGEVRFKFQGTVFWESDNTVKKDLSGEINLKALPSMDCSTAKSGVSYYSDQTNFHSFSHNMTRFSNGFQTHRYFLNNGYILDMITEDDFWNLPLGTLGFDENSNANKITFQKLEGNIVANQLPHLDQYQWIDFPTNGQIIISEKLIENGEKVIKGQLNLNFVNEEGVLTSLHGIKFSTGSFEN